MSECQDAIGSAVSGTHTAFLGARPARRSLGSSVIPRRVCSRLPGAQKNALRNLWAAAPHLVRSPHAPRARSRLWLTPDLCGARAAAGRVPALQDGEAGRVGLPRPQSVLHEALRVLGWAPVPRLDDSGCRAGGALELEDRQGARDAVHASRSGERGRQARV